MTTGERASTGVKLPASFNLDLSVAPSKFHDTADVKAQLVDNLPALVGELIPAAKRRGAEWRCGDLAGSAGSSLWIGARGQWKDHATDEGGGPLDLIKACMGLDFASAKDWAVHWLGLDDAAVKADHAVIQARQQQAQAKADQEAQQDRQRRFEVAKSIWESGEPVSAQNLAGRYLAGRGIAFDRLGAEPLRVMRFVGNCPIGSNQNGHTAPALVFRVDSASNCQPAGIHRVFLNSDGTKSELGKRRLGSARTPIIRFHEAHECGLLAIAEGPETALSLWANANIQPIWCCVDAGGMSRFPLVGGVTSLAVWADRGGAGEKAADEVARRYADAGCWARVKVSKLSDFDDQLTGGRQ